MTNPQALATSNAQIAPVTPMTLIERASAAGASIEQMQQLFELKLRVEADEARKAFDEAMSQFKANLPRIVKSSEITGGPLAGKKYADLYAVVSAVTPALSQYGLSASWRITKDAPDWIEITCTIRHRQGHSEIVSMGGPPDAGGAKNPIQARASTASYLERYTLLMAIGTAAAGTDTDGMPDAEPSMPDQQYTAHMDNIANAGSAEELKRLYLNAIKDARKVADKNAEVAFEKAKDKRKGELA